MTDALPQWPAHYYSDYRRPTPAPAIITVDRFTRIEIVTEYGNRSPLPAYWLWSRLADGASYRDGYTDQPIAILRRENVELVQIQTNFASGHQIAVSPDAPLCCWDGETVLAGECRERRQLLGKYGMYVVTQCRKVMEVVAFLGNFSSAGGIYVGPDANA